MILLSITLCIAFIFGCIFYIGGNVNSNLTNFLVLYNSPSIIAISTTIRTICVIIMLVLGKKTIQCRNESEERMRRISNLHGADAEELDLLTILRKGVKDVFTVNIWTCIFLLPMTVVSILILLGFASLSGTVIFRVNAICKTMYTIANPIIYLTCFTKIREFWAR